MALLGPAGPARAGRVAVLVVSSFSPSTYSDRGAVGLLVPGAGTTVSRAGALAALERGRVRKSLLGGVPHGQPLIALGRRPGPITIYVSLPPPGTHANRRRYPIAIVGGGYRGLLLSRSTRIPGLVSVADVAPTALALDRGRSPVITSRRETDAPGELGALDRRLSRVHDARVPATIVLVSAVLGGSALALLSGSWLVARAALLAAPAALGTAIALSAAGVSRPSAVVPALAALTVAVSLAGAALLASARRLALGLAAAIALYLVALAARPVWNSLAAIGPNPDEGGRFYGTTNLTATVLLTVSLLAAALLGPRWAVAVSLLALATVGWSRAGADGGGLLVLAAGFAALGLRLRGIRLSARLLALAAAATVALGLALVGLDAATGGSSHVTGAVGAGPGSLARDLAGRIHISLARATSSWHAGLVVAVSLGALALLARRPPRFVAGDALLVALAVSLLVNDTPTDVASGGALSYGVLWTWERVRGA